MPIMDPKKATERHRVSEFGGIRTNARLSPLGASDMRNFRILSDGSLEKRCGTRLRFYLTGSVRGAWEGTVEGKSYFFVVAGASVYRLTEDDPVGEPIPIYYLPTDSGRVSFLFYADRLYLDDGIALCRFIPGLESFTVADGYTPLYGKNWSPGGMGAIYEPRNLIQNRIRLHYVNTLGETEFRLPYSAKRIERLKINGRTVTNFSFVEGSTTFHISNDLAMQYGNVEVAVALDPLFDRRTAILNGALATVYSDPYREAVIFGGGTAGYRLYYTTPVSEEQLNASASFYSNSDPLYVCEGSEFSVGSAQHPITALLQSGRQLLIFNDRTMWALRYPKSDSNAPEILLLRSGIGCSSRFGALLCDSDVVTVQENGITRIDFDPNDPDVCETESLSIPISNKLSQEMLKRAILLWQRSVGELWVRDPDDSLGTVWIYSKAHKSWYAYAGLNASCLFEGFGTVGFGTPMGRFYLMDESYDTDAGEPIDAWYESLYLEPDWPEAPRRIGRACLCADLGGSELDLTVESEHETQSFTLSGNTRNGAPSLFDCRLYLGRFRLLRYKLSAVGTSRCRIHYLSLLANN